MYILNTVFDCIMQANKNHQLERISKTLEIMEKKNMELNGYSEFKNLSKYEQLVYCLIELHDSPSTRDLSKICNKLYFIDFAYYELFKENLIDEEYRKTETGALPVFFENTVENLIKKGLVKKEITLKGTTNFTSAKINSEMNSNTEKQDPDFSSFSKKEIEFVKYSLEIFVSLNPNTLLNIIKEDVPFLNADENEIINKELVFSRMNVSITNLEQKLYVKTYN